jgi:hypothetical protein
MMQNFLYPTEFVHNMDPHNFPRRKISWKLGLPVMLLRNINHSTGFCNCTRLMVTRFGWVDPPSKDYDSGNIGDRVCIPRIVLNAPATKCPLTLQRRQYPLCLYYKISDTWPRNLCFGTSSFILLSQESNIERGIEDTCTWWIIWKTDHIYKEYCILFFLRIRNIVCLEVLCHL